jgi:DNA-binding transcriptional regulator YhcF (GntR family)
MRALLCNFFVICRVAITGEEVYTTEEVAEKLRVTPKTVESGYNGAT